MGLRSYIKACDNIEELRAMALDLLKYKKEYKKLLKELESKDTRPVLRSDSRIEPKIYY